MSASSKTIYGAFPPSSIETFFMVSAALRTSVLPTEVEPVKEILRTSRLAMIASLISCVFPATALRTPSGTPACFASVSSAKALSGVLLAGLITPVHPAASAGPNLRVSMAIGKFHGVIAATTPMGSRVARMREPGLIGGIISPFARLASSANHWIKLAAYSTSPSASFRGLPCSVVINRPSQLLFSIISSYQR